MVEKPRRDLDPDPIKPIRPPDPDKPPVIDKPKPPDLGGGTPPEATQLPSRRPGRETPEPEPEPPPAGGVGAPLPHPRDPNTSGGGGVPGATP